ncbi:MAG: diguanylate cyclase [Oscillospiraceae bacterium]|nr:diguanylate cyclase [Oscillospiraceae bacterium]
MSENKKNTVLVVDDETTNIIALSNILSDIYDVRAAKNGSDAIMLANEHLPDVILLDVLMPEMDGYDVIASLKNFEATKAIPVIFITGFDNSDAEKKGLTLGAADYIPKPFVSDIVKLRVQNQMTIVNQIRALHERATALQEQTNKLIKVQNSMASVLANMVENRDKLTGKHAEQTSKNMRIIIDEMVKRGVYANETANWNIDVIVSSSRLHDIGKIVVSDLILNKPGKLTVDEYSDMKKHALEGESIIGSIINESGDDEFLQNAKIVAGSHHERWDGTGYPRGLKGTEIPLHGRIMALVDVYDALISKRPYKPAFSHEKAVDIILEGKGNHFDPNIVDVFYEINEQFYETQDDFFDELEGKLINRDGKHTIMIVDDEPANIMALTNILSPDYDICAAKNGIDAIALAKERLPDVILLDVLMPGMDGYEVISILKNSEETQAIPVVFITGLEKAEFEERGLSLGASDYITKPFHSSVVKVRVQKQIQYMNQFNSVKELSIIDELTGVTNRRGYESRFHLEWNRAKREQKPISLMMIDIDHFKAYNDTYGHLQGDIALKTVAQAIEHTLKRPADFCARWGGEEFVVLLPDTELEGTLSLAEEIRESIENLSIASGHGTITKLTVSIGLNALTPMQDASSQNFVAGADYALYAAKTAGRNKVVKFEG